MADLQGFLDGLGSLNLPDTGTGGRETAGKRSNGLPSTQTRVLDAMLRTDNSGYTRNVNALLSTHAQEVHQANYMVEWRMRTLDLHGVDGRTLLASLADSGFAWRDIARMLGVSIPAVQKWRKGEGLSGESVKRLAQLVAGCDLIVRFNPLIQDIAQWFDVPVVAEAPITPIDFWASGNQQLVFECARVDASLRVDPHITMDSFDAYWRDTYRSDFETFRAADGDISISPRKR